MLTLKLKEACEGFYLELTGKECSHANQFLTIGKLALLFGALFLGSACEPTAQEPISILPVKKDTVWHFKAEVEMMPIDSASYTPLYGRDSALVYVQAFLVDKFPVTNEEFREFVTKNPQWRRSRVKKIFADESYLYEWASDTTYAAHMLPNAPVSNISWFAATAYANCVGKRLCTLDEWEYLALADAENKDARIKESYNEELLTWYEKRNTYKNPVGQNPSNVWQVNDIHGLVWEWIQDFNSVMMTGESRKDGSNDNKLFCGSASLGAADKMNYAAFIRYAFRGSLKANYCVKNLGFRCAKSIN